MELRWEHSKIAKVEVGELFINAFDENGKLVCLSKRSHPLPPRRGDGVSRGYAPSGELVTVILGEREVYRWIEGGL